MKAICLFKEKYELTRADGGLVVIYMDLYQVPDGVKVGLPDGFRFSWIAFDPDNPSNRVLFDCHSPKGPHFHLGDDAVETSYQWNNIVEAEKFFFELVEKHFGKLGGKQS